MEASRKFGLRTWIEINKKAIGENYRLFRSLIGKNCKLLAVVKSNAYGHGLRDFAEFISKMGADWLGVDSVVEAVSLRQLGLSKPILIFGYTLPETVDLAVKNDVSLTVSSFPFLRFVVKEAAFSKKPIRAHIKVDTGMNRQGFLDNDLAAVIKELGKAKNIEVEGLYTHFAAAKNPAFPQRTEAQMEKFKRWVNKFREVGFKPTTHAAATAGALLFPESRFDMIRIGIGLYGIWPAKEVREALRDRISLKPVLSWKTIISEIKKAPAGSRVGYDGAETLSRDSRIAVCPVGYWHGYPRALSSIGRVLVGGGEAKVLGRVSMDMIVVDLTEIPEVKVGDEVVLIGKKGRLKVSVDDLACLTDGSSYEIVTRLNPLMRRLYT